MIQIQQIKVSIQEKEQEKALRKKICKLLRITDSEILSIDIRKKSIDARKKPELYYVYTVYVSVSKKISVSKLKNNNITEVHPKSYAIPDAFAEHEIERPVIIGLGPAGLFAAYLLALCNAKPIVLERGKQVEERREDVQKFWETGVLDTKSNVQFGEGGAGTFSDGKLNTLVKDKFGRNRFVLETFVKFGANPDILSSFKPHIGTDVLVSVVSNMRKEILRLGGEIRFETCVTDFDIVSSGETSKIKGVWLNQEEYLPVSDVILAIGHSARDTFKVLHEKQVPMLAKDFAVGFRVEHPQRFINLHQYGIDREDLPVAPYKLATTLENGRGVYSFCMCPGGYVVNASSEEHRLVVNGMSYSDRGSKNANSAIVVSVGEKEFDKSNPLAGIEYQRKIEEKAYEIGNGSIPQQLLKDFIKGETSTSYGHFESETRGNTTFARVDQILSEELNASFIEGMKQFDKKISGYYMEDAILSGVESRTSSPVRISRNDDFMSDIKGLYPCGEGAGYAGGITSAAMDGLKCAEKLMEKYRS